MASLKDNDMEKANEKRFTTSKVNVFITGSIFVIVIAFVLYMYIAGRIDSTFDTAALITCVTVSGAIFGSNLCWYSKKAASENHYKLRMALFSDSAKIRLEYNESMMKLMKKYEIRETDLEKIDSSGDLDDMMDSAINSVVSELDNVQDEADSSNEIEQFNM